MTKIKQKQIESFLITVILITFAVFIWYFVTHIFIQVEPLIKEVNGKVLVASQQEVPQSIIFKVTAYCPCEKCCKKETRITASGYVIRKGDKFCASPLPYLTILKIPGYGIAPVLDRGSAITGFCIDVYFDTHQEALNWGVQYLAVEILK